MRLIRTGNLPRLLREDVAQRQGRNRVQHDGDNDFVCPGLCLKNTGDSRIERTGNHRRKKSNKSVNDGRQVHGEANPDSGKSTKDDLAFTTDVEQACAEAQGKAQATQYQGDGEEQGLCQRFDLTLETTGAWIKDRSAEHRVVGIDHRCSGHCNQNRTDSEGDENRKDGNEPSRSQDMMAHNQCLRRTLYRGHQFSSTCESETSTCSCTPSTASS